jgi:4-hydroxy-tetrahydrodipicolinate synthase
VLSGDDGITLPLLTIGGRGLISVSANEIPGEMTRLVQLALANDFAAAREIHRRYFRLMEANFVETNPGPVKAAMALMGLLEPVFRLPLVAPKPENLAKIRSALESVGLIQGVYAAR